MLKQRRDNFQFGGKHKLNLKLTVFFYLTWKPDVFFRNAEVLNAGIKFVKKKLEFKTDLDHTQECERFSCCIKDVYVREEWDFKYHITGKVLCFDLRYFV